MLTVSMLAKWTANFAAAMVQKIMVQKMETNEYRAKFKQ